MNVKITNKQIVLNVPIIANLAKRDLPVKASYAIGKNKTKLEKIYNICEEERIKLVEKYGPKNDEGTLIQDENGIVKFSPENAKLYNNDYNELLSIENDLDIHMFKLSLIENYDMKADELTAIDFMIEE